MMTETQQFLEQLKDPFRFAVRKACFDFHNNPRYHSLIYDLRIQQINEAEHYNIILVTKDFHHQITLLPEFADILSEYMPSHITTSYSKTDELNDGKFQRIFYAYDESTTIPF